VVVNTELEDPATAGPARALFERRERYVWDTYRSLAARFYREAAEAHGHEFWTSRARAAPAAPGTEDPSVAFLDASDPLDTGGEPDVDAFRRDPRVLSSFAQLRQAPGIRLRPGEALQRIQGPAVQGRRIVLEDRLAAEDLEDGIRYLRGIDLVHLVEIAPAHEQVPDLFDAYCRTRRPVILPDFLGALSVLLARGLLVNEWA
jgi:hypothetical protein